MIYPTTQVYLAGRYDRREELLEFAKRLEATGRFTVTSRWVQGSHEMPIDSTGKLRPDLMETNEGGSVSMNDREGEAARVTASFAMDDFVDIQRSDVVIHFTENHTAGYNRGGRHVEFGLALAMGKINIIVGDRENVFHFLPGVHVVGSADQILEYFGAKESEPAPLN